jgi:hypothetical protein
MAQNKALVAILLLMAVNQATSQGSTDLELAEIQSEIALITRCAHAARFVIKAAELQPTNKERRDLILSGALEDAQKQNRLGSQAPTVLNLHFAKIDDMLARGPDPDNKNVRDWHLAQSAASCTLYSYRAKPR